MTTTTTTTDKKTYPFKPKRCTICDETFQPASGSAKYCPSCAALVRRGIKRRTKRNWRKANPDAYREQTRISVQKWRKANPDKARAATLRQNEARKEQRRQRGEAS